MYVIFFYNIKCKNVIKALSDFIKLIFGIADDEPISHIAFHFHHLFRRLSCLHFSILYRTNEEAENIWKKNT